MPGIEDLTAATGLTRADFEKISADVKANHAALFS